MSILGHIEMFFISYNCWNIESTNFFIRETTLSYILLWVLFFKKILTLPLHSAQTRRNTDQKNSVFGDFSPSMLFLKVTTMTQRSDRNVSLWTSLKAAFYGNTNPLAPSVQQKYVWVCMTFLWTRGVVSSITDNQGPEFSPNINGQIFLLIHKKEQPCPIHF